MLTDLLQETVTTKIAEGLWLSPGQPPRNISFVSIHTTPDLTENKVIYNNCVQTSRSAHGNHNIIPINANGSVLWILFHSSNTDCSKLTLKKLYSKKFGLWEDDNLEEKMVLTKVESGSTIANRFMTNVRDLYSTEELFKVITEHNRNLHCATGLRTFPSDTWRWKREDTMFILKWCHTGQYPAFVFCQKNSKIVVLAKNGGFSSEHGLWTYDAENDTLSTHLEVDPEGLYKKQTIYFMRLKTEITKCFLATSEIEISEHLTCTYDPEEHQELRKWHIFAQIVWLCEEHNSFSISGC